MVDAIRTAVGSHTLVVPIPGALLTTLSRAVSLALRDTLLTHDEYPAMADGLADSDAPATGTIVLTNWIAEHAPDLGRRYTNETRPPLPICHQSEAPGRHGTMSQV